MSDHERALLLTGTLDTSDIGASPYQRLQNVSLAFEGDGEAAEATPEKVAENSSLEPEGPAVAEPVKEEPEAKPTARKRTAKKTQASAPAEK
ncbi:hypothetical protein ACPCSE_29615 [Streptomyces cellulosae]